ncbi:MAG: hypothetical protein WCX65_14705 [bacterium]
MKRLFVTKENASGAEQSASAAEELSSQANQLAYMVKKFKMAIRAETMKAQNLAEMLSGIDMGLLKQLLSQTKAQQGLLGNGGKKQLFEAKKAINPKDIIVFDDEE